MEEEDDDDIYAPDESIVPESAVPTKNGVDGSAQKDLDDAIEDEEEGEEVDEEGSDSDIDIITERKGAPDTKSESVPTAHVKELKAPAASTPSEELSHASRASHAVKVEAPPREGPSRRPGSSYPAVKSSTIDVDAIPIYEPTGKPLTDMDMDTDFPEDDKPWRRPGTDMTDYFNYGFDEFTWASYCLKQQKSRKEVADSKKQMEDMQSFFGNGMPQMPGMSGAPSGGAPPAMPSMGATPDIPPDMQQMFQQMMAQGLDPMTMGPDQMMAMMQGGNPMGDATQNFGGQGFGQQGQGGHQMGYGGGFGGSGGGNQGGRGRGRRW